MYSQGTLSEHFYSVPFLTYSHEAIIHDLPLWPLWAVFNVQPCTDLSGYQPFTDLSDVWSKPPKKNEKKSHACKQDFALLGGKIIYEVLLLSQIQHLQ